MADVDPTPYTGPERRGHHRRTDDLEEVATFLRAKRLVEEHDGQQIRRNAMVAIICASLIGIFVAVAMGVYFKDNATINARRNCEVQAKGRLTGNGRAFVQSRILIVADEAFKQFPERFRDAELARINRELHAVRGRLAANAPGVVDDFADLQALLPIQPRLDCDRLIQ